MRLVLFVVLIAIALPAAAGVLTEDFNAPFPAWESGWFGVNSNAVNYYVIAGSGLHSDRGNNPDGLWITDGTNHSGDVIISFLPSFAETLTSLSIDIAGYVNLQFEIFDAENNVLLSTPLTLTGGGTTNPGVYAHYSTTSSNGIGGFRFLGNVQIEGNTSIDNVVVNQGETAVPEPAACGLIGAGLLALAGMRRRLAR